METPALRICIHDHLSHVQKHYRTCLIICAQGDLVRTIGESAAVGASGSVLWGASADYDDRVTSHHRPLPDC